MYSRCRNPSGNVRSFDRRFFVHRRSTAGVCPIRSPAPAADAMNSVENSIPVVRNRIFASALRVTARSPQWKSRTPVPNLILPHHDRNGTPSLCSGGIAPLSMPPENLSPIITSYSPSASG